MRARVAALSLGVFVAGWANAQGVPTARLLAPEPVRPLIEEHFDARLPTPADATARAAFLRRAQREIGELLASEGWFSPTIALQPGDVGDEGVLVITPGRRTRVARVDLEFRGAIAGAGGDYADRIAALRQAWPLEAGAPFRSPDWENAKAALLAGVARRDFAAAALVDSRAEVDPEAATARLGVVIDSGPALKFGAIAISGLKRYDEALVRNQAPFRPGDPYRQDQLLDFQTRLQNIPLFGSVIVGYDPARGASTAGDAPPVQVALAESRARQFSLGAGYSSNTGARGELAYRDYNFMHRAWRLTSGLALEQNRQALTAAVDTYPDEKGYRLSWTANAEATDIQGLRTVRQALGAARLRTLGRIETRLGLEWQREVRRPVGGIEETNSALVADARWTRRDVDDLLLPRRGNLLDVRLGGARRELLSDQDFLRTHVRYQGWWPVGLRDVVSLRVEGGFTAAESRFGIPQQYLFRAGGAQSVRGYAYQSLGVREGEAVVGGRAMASGSLEYTHWLTGDWGAAIFVDAGDAADSWRALRPVVGSGIGARWRSPAGPLGIDFGYGHDVGKWRVDFSIAVAF